MTFIHYQPLLNQLTLFCAADDDVEITLRMLTDLQVSTDGGVQFTLPTVLSPRYCPPGSQGPDAEVTAGEWGKGACIWRCY